jgi:SAM-dependent methyltransferase
MDLTDLRAELRRDVPGAPLGTDLVRRYRDNYGVSEEEPLTEEMVLRHWNLERRLTRGLLTAPADGRAQSFHQAYDELYRSLPWLNRAGDQPAAWEEVLADDMLALIGPPPQRVLELGSGRGLLARRLAGEGHLVRASDVAPERKPAWADTVERLSWLVLDAVHPDLSEPAGSCDAVITHQVLEHLHPDDLPAHFAAVCRLLAPGGRYIFTTPHAFLGPADLSLVMGADRPLCMHLREYSYRELAAMARRAGFARVTAGFRWPLRAARALGAGTRMRSSAAYFRHLLGWERLLAGIPSRRQRKAMARLARLGLFREIPLVAWRGV